MNDADKMMKQMDSVARRMNRRQTVEWIMEEPHRLPNIGIAAGTPIGLVGVFLLCQSIPWTSTARIGVALMINAVLLTAAIVSMAYLKDNM